MQEIEFWRSYRTKMKLKKMITNTNPAAAAKRKSPSRMKTKSISKTRREGSRINSSIPIEEMRMLGRMARFRLPMRESISARAKPKPIAVEPNKLP